MSMRTAYLTFSKWIEAQANFLGLNKIYAGGGSGVARCSSITGIPSTTG